MTVLGVGLLGLTPAHAESPQVVATLKPIHSLTAMAMSGVGAPALLLDGAASPHDYALRPSDARLLGAARLVVMVGPAMETFLDKPLRSLAGEARVLKLAQVADMGLPQGDAHLWLDPENAGRAVLAIGRALGEVDPPHAYEYTRNAAQARERLAALDRELRRILAPVKDRPFVVAHDAFRGFAARYGLRLVGAVVAGHEHAPGARAMAALADKARAAGALCVFTVPQYEAAEARALARAIGARVAELDDLGAAIPPGPDMYFVLMRGIAASLVACLSS